MLTAAWLSLNWTSISSVNQPRCTPTCPDTRPKTSSCTDTTSSLGSMAVLATRLYNRYILYIFVYFLYNYLRFTYFMLMIDDIFYLHSQLFFYLVYPAPEFPKALQKHLVLHLGCWWVSHRRTTTRPCWRRTTTQYLRKSYIKTKVIIIVYSFSALILKLLILRFNWVVAHVYIYVPRYRRLICRYYFLSQISQIVRII